MPNDLPILPQTRSFLTRPQKMLIGGKWLDAACGAAMSFRNPATGEVLGVVPSASAEDVDCALREARQAFDDIEDAIRLANDNRYGLGASIWSNNLAAVHRMIPRIKSGSVWVNCHSALDPALPFGGYKMSGVGREMGAAVIEHYTELKSVLIKLCPP